jgi:spore germination cell wall hydrolase CwlJ-like protein
MRLIPDDTWAILTIWIEARGEPFEGKLAVAEVIRNRTARHYNSNGTVAGTVLQPYQFSGWNTKDPNRISAAQLDDADLSLAECRRAWAQAQTGSDIAKGAVLYFNPRVVGRPSWADISKRVAIIGHHEFFTA